MFFVSSEQIHANTVAAVNHFFNPLEEDEDATASIAALVPWAIESQNESKIDKIWAPCIWTIELMEIQPQDCEQHVWLLPTHKKFRVLSGPCVGAITFDDGQDVFIDLDSAYKRARTRYDDGLRKLQDSLQIKHSPKIVG